MKEVGPRAKANSNVTIETGPCPKSCQITATHHWAALTATTCKLADHYEDFENSDDLDLFEADDFFGSFSTSAFHVARGNWCTEFKGEQLDQVNDQIQKYIHKKSPSLLIERGTCSQAGFAEKYPYRREASGVIVTVWMQNQSVVPTVVEALPDFMI